MVTTLILDIGNVLLPFDYRPAEKLLAEKMGLPVDELKALADPAMLEVETGRMSERDFFEKLAKASHHPLQIGEAMAIWAEIFTVNEPMVTFMSQVRQKGRKVYLLSNAGPTHVRHIREQYSFINEADGALFSCDVGLMKPDAAIFHCLLDRFSLTPGACLFVDDLPRNVEGAEQMGLKGFVYDRLCHEDFLAFARQCGMHG